jgi:hypothetical protein
MYIQYIKGLLQSRLVTTDYALLFTSSSCYHSSSDTWTVVHMTASKFKPLILSVLGFALSNIANIFIFRVRVRVTLRLTVYQSVHLGVEPTLGLTTRCYFPLEVWCFWGLRSRYDYRSVSQYVLASIPPWDLRPDINFVWISLCCLCWAPSLTKGRVCLLSVTVSNNCPLSIFYFVFVCLFFSHFTRHIFYLYTIHARPSQPRLSKADHAPSFVASTTTAI